MQSLDHKCGVNRRQIQCAKNGLTIGMKNVRQHMAQQKFVMVDLIIEMTIELVKF
jgi:hypothetical protein